MEAKDQVMLYSFLLFSQKNTYLCGLFEVLFPQGSK